MQYIRGVTGVPWHEAAFTKKQTFPHDIDYDICTINPHSFMKTCRKLESQDIVMWSNIETKYVLNSKIYFLPVKCFRLSNQFLS